MHIKISRFELLMGFIILSHCWYHVNCIYHHTHLELGYLTWLTTSYVLVLINLATFYIQFRYISEILQWRSQRTAEHILFTLVGSKGTPNGTLSCAQLHKKAERVACTLVERGRVNSGDHVALVYPPGLDLVCAFYGCLYVGTSTILNPFASSS